MRRYNNDPETTNRRMQERGERVQQQARGDHSRLYYIVVYGVTILFALIIIGIIIMALITN